MIGMTRIAVQQLAPALGDVEANRALALAGALLSAVALLTLPRTATRLAIVPARVAPQPA